MRADIHDDPEHNRSKQRSDTLMQDRICRIDENLLHRAAGPYIWVKRFQTIHQRANFLAFRAAAMTTKSTASARPWPTKYPRIFGRLRLSTLTPDLVGLGRFTTVTAFRNSATPLRERSRSATLVNELDARGSKVGS